MVGRLESAVTLWAALNANLERNGCLPVHPEASGWRETRRQAESDLTPLQLQAARQRGAKLSLTVAAELVVVLTSTGPTETLPPSGIGELTARERELVVLVARGRTNAQIAAQLFISVRTVGSHLDRIRDKTGCRRRADLTRLALRESLI